MWWYYLLFPQAARADLVRASDKAADKAARLSEAERRAEELGAQLEKVRHARTRNRPMQPFTKPTFSRSG